MSRSWAAVVPAASRIVPSTEGKRLALTAKNATAYPPVAMSWPRRRARMSLSAMKRATGCDCPREEMITASGPTTRSTAAGRAMAASIINRPCRVSVALTAQNPPSRVYSIFAVR